MKKSVLAILLPVALAFSAGPVVAAGVDPGMFPSAPPPKTGPVAPPDTTDMQGKIGAALSGLGGPSPAGITIQNYRQNMTPQEMAVQVHRQAIQSRLDDINREFSDLKDRAYQHDPEVIARKKILDEAINKAMGGLPEMERERKRMKEIVAKAKAEPNGAERTKDLRNFDNKEFQSLRHNMVSRQMNLHDNPAVMDATAKLSEALTAAMIRYNPKFGELIKEYSDLKVQMMELK